MNSRTTVAGQRAFKGVRAPATKSPIAAAAVSLKEPPYALNALEPHMSENTMNYHWGKHHKAYVDNLNKQIAGTDLDGKALEEIIVAAWNNGSPTPEFNNAAQVWNHTFFWEGMAPNAGGAPSGKLAEAIDKAFGSFDDFKSQFATAGATQFGSGWAWLCASPDGSLEILKTPNAVCPLVEGKVAILTMDVWEHAYYLDFQNARPAYINTYLENLVSWDAVAARYEAACAQAISQGILTTHFTLSVQVVRCCIGALVTYRTNTFCNQTKT
eukprot:TRINITY_DN2548_c0_g1_i1.p1 TRINITY_DN2548_c0_g1~~TRINITY_DN2548_c0_g1_i1.p1  ORF type:complete len:270 (+),score=27.08 TRINITY_DN2548_c0_g1_i1:643-1452(+)